jgi:hypothetical protein
MAVWYSLLSFGIFFHFGMFGPRKIWQPCLGGVVQSSSHPPEEQAILVRIPPGYLEEEKIVAVLFANLYLICINFNVMQVLKGKPRPLFSLCALAAWNSGHHFRHQNRRLLVRILPGCTFYIDV